MRCYIHQQHTLHARELLYMLEWSGCVARTFLRVFFFLPPNDSRQYSRNAATPQWLWGRRECVGVLYAANPIVFMHVCIRVKTLCDLQGTVAFSRPLEKEDSEARLETKRHSQIYKAKISKFSKTSTLVT